MKGIKSFKLMSIILVLAYLLSACSGAASQPTTPAGGGKPQPKEVAFTGTVEAISAGAITVSGQIVTLDAGSVLDPNIKVGDIVKVEAQVSETGAVVALTVETSSVDDNANVNDTNINDNSNTSDDNTNSGDNTNSDGNSNDASQNNQEVTGVVQAVSAESVTIDGVVYQFGSSTEFKDTISVGDSVKLHVIVNADGSFTVTEIKKSDDTTIGDDNSNSNTNDDNGNDNNGNDDNGNDDNSNDDHGGDDDNSNGNGNGNGG